MQVRLGLASFCVQCFDEEPLALLTLKLPNQPAVMNFVDNMSEGFYRVEGGLPIRTEVEQQQKILSCAMQSQKFAYNSSYSSQTVASTQKNINHAQRSSNPFREDATEADWDAYLFGCSRTTQDVPMPAPSTSSMEPTAEKIRLQKRHYAHITFVPSAEGLKPVVSHKRRRTAFTTDQVTALEQVFQTKPYVTREERSILVQQLAVGDQAIKVWFQNRRLKHKKELEEELEAAQPYPYTMFPHTELLLQQVDKDGQVTLNQQSIDELVIAIDAHLPVNLDLNKLIADLERCVTEESSISYDSIHEPISPPEAGTFEQPRSTQEWWNLEVIDPKQSLQRLLDLHRSL